jgi:hypothetical protein
MTLMEKRLDAMRNRRSADEEHRLAVQMKKDYCKKYGLRPLPPSCWPTCSDSILRNRRNGRLQHADRYRDGYDCRGPHADHNSGFFDPQTREIVGVEQPYFGYPPKSLEEITRDAEAFAAAHGLKVRVSADESWHCPGRTVLIEYRRAALAERMTRQ